MNLKPTRVTPYANKDAPAMATHFILVHFDSSLSPSVSNTLTFWDLQRETERLIKSDLVMRAISLEPADGAKSLVISSRQASKPFDSRQMTRCHFPPAVLPLIMLFCWRYIKDFTLRPHLKVSLRLSGRSERKHNIIFGWSFEGLAWKQLTFKVWT